MSSGAESKAEWKAGESSKAESKAEFGAESLIEFGEELNAANGSEWKAERELEPENYDETIRR